MATLSHITPHPLMGKKMYKSAALSYHRTQGTPEGSRPVIHAELAYHLQALLPGFQQQASEDLPVKKKAIIITNYYYYCY